MITTIILSEEDVKLIEERSKIEDRSRSQIIRIAVRKYLNEVKNGK